MFLSFKIRRGTGWTAPGVSSQGRAVGHTAVARHDITCTYCFEHELCLDSLYSESSSSSSLSSSLSLPLSSCLCKKSIKGSVFSLTFFMSSVSVLFSSSHHW
jgi:hypothetical protein